MNFETKNVTNWILFLLITLSTFGVVYQAIAETTKEIEQISTDIVEMSAELNAKPVFAKTTTNPLDIKPTSQTIKNMDEKQITKATFKTSYGDIEVSFRKETPMTVANFTKLAKEGFYEGVRFHRVIKGFMIQAGDPKSKNLNLKNEWGTGGPGYQFKDELSGKETYEQGTLAMANAGPNTNGSQFFIVTASPVAPLPPSYTVFGKVIKGMDVALAIENVATAPGDRPVKDVIIEKIVLE